MLKTTQLTVQMDIRMPKTRCRAFSADKTCAVKQDLNLQRTIETVIVKNCQ